MGRVRLGAGRGSRTDLPPLRKGKLSRSARPLDEESDQKAGVAGSAPPADRPCPGDSEEPCERHHARLPNSSSRSESRHGAGGGPGLSRTFGAPVRRMPRARACHGHGRSRLQPPGPRQQPDGPRLALRAGRRRRSGERGAGGGPAGLALREAREARGADFFSTPATEAQGGGARRVSSRRRQPRAPGCPAMGVGQVSTLRSVGHRGATSALHRLMSSAASLQEPADWVQILAHSFQKLTLLHCSEIKRHLFHLILIYSFSGKFARVPDKEYSR